MKKSISLFAAIWIGLSSFGQLPVDHFYPAEFILKHGITSCSVFGVDKNGTPTPEEIHLYDSLGAEIEYKHLVQQLSYDYQYSADGKRTATIVQSDDGGTWEKTSLFYDDDGNLIKEVNSYKNGSEYARTEYSYKKNRLHEKRHYLKGNLRTKVTYSYDKKQNTRTENHFFKGNPSDTYIYQLNDNGKPITLTILDAEDQVLSTLHCKYNSQGLRIEQRILDRKGHLTDKYTTTYTKEGFLDYIESWTGIEDADFAEARYKKKMYRYQ